MMTSVARGSVRVLAAAVVIMGCGRTKTPSDGGAGAHGGGGQSGAGVRDAGTGGGGGTDGSGGQGDAGSCRMAAQSCTARECCVGLLCIGGACTTAPSGDAGDDATLTCSYPDGGASIDGSAFNGVCPATGCPAGTVCVFEIGGVAGGGGESCAPIPDKCHGTPTCACMGGCACTNTFGRPETCSDQRGSIACDDGIR
ncbi:MAG: hypothetical protein ABIS92_03050 [Polyangia bacterium]